jgi:hypothetical protein
MIFYPDVGGSDFGGFGVGGPGLGNMLFPWARAIVYQAKYGGEILAPCWIQIKPRRLFFGDRDQRNYKGFFSSEGYVTGIRREFFRLLNSPVKEESLEETKKEGAVVRVSGMKNMFEDILHERDLVKKSFNDMLNINMLDTALPKKYIAVHVRLGDFALTDDPTKNNSRIPMAWYVRSITRLQSQLNLPVLIFSDGSSEELQDLLGLDGVERVELETALHEMLALANSSALITSGSTFSMWACFLGSTNSYWYPGKLKFPAVFSGSDNLNLVLK